MLPKNVACCCCFRWWKNLLKGSNGSSSTVGATGQYRSAEPASSSLCVAKLVIRMPARPTYLLGCLGKTSAAHIETHRCVSIGLSVAGEPMLPKKIKVPPQSLKGKIMISSATGNWTNRLPKTTWQFGSSLLKLELHSTWSHVGHDCWHFCQVKNHQYKTSSALGAGWIWPKPAFCRQWHRLLWSLWWSHKPILL